MPKRSRSRKKNRTHVAAASSTPDGSTNPEKVPKSLIVRRGKTCHEMDELVNDMRRMMLPYTAMNYQDTNTTKSKKISLQQYSTGIALPMGITHIIQLSQSSSGTASSTGTSRNTTSGTSNHQENHDYCNMRIARVPEGPVLYFRIHQFTLIRHIQSIQRKPIALNTTSITNHSPIVVTNNFGDHTASSHIKLLRITFQNLFPQINVSTIKLRDCRRVVLFNLIETTTTSNNTSDDTHNTIQVIEMRHYAVKATPLGMNRKVRRILEVAKKTNKAPPNLHNVHDIADYITNQSTSLSMNGSTTSSINTANSNNNNNDVMSDSEPEDDVEHHVTLPDTYVGVGNVAKQTSALKLVEIGPRLSLQLLKVEKGLSDTNKIVLYNVHVTKSKEEIESKQNEINRTLQIKEERKRQQEQNVEQKRILKERKLQQKQLKIQHQTQESGDGMVDTENNIQSNNTMVHDRDSSDDDDDEDAYKIEGVSSSDDEENDGNDNYEDEMDDNE